MLSTRPKSQNAENAHAIRQFSMKTPARGLRNENANRQTPAAHLKNVEMKTPFRPADLQDPMNLKTAPRTAARPFLDKTPYPNRIADDVQFQTPFAVNLLDFGSSPGSFHRPSSLRKHIRIPRGSLGKEIQTPPQRSDQWDISDVSIDLPEVVQAIPPVVENDDDDDDEIEYMAPNTFDLPYQPPFDFELPNYKEVGKRLVELAYLHPYDDEDFQPPEVDMDPNDIGIMSWDMPSIPDVADDDPFPAVNPEPKVKPPAAPAAPRTLPSKALSQPPATTVAARTKVPIPVHSRTQFGARETTVKSRPGTSASMAPPSTRSRIAESSMAAKPRPLSSLEPKRPTIAAASKATAAKPRPLSSLEPRRPIIAATSKATTKTTSVDPSRSKPSSSLVRKPSSVVRTATTTPAVLRRPVVSTKATTTVASKKKPVSSQDNLLVLAVPSDVLDDDFMFDV